MIKQKIPFIVSSLMLFSLVVARSSEQTGPTNQVKGFELKDQFKKTHKQFFPKDRVSIFALADRKGSDQLEGWITSFYKRYENRVAICGIANLKGVPKMMRPLLRSLFRKGLNYPVMMDWSGEICEAFNSRPQVADIFVISKDGVVVHRISGEASKEKLKACFQVVDELIREQKSGKNADHTGAPQLEGSPPAQESTAGAPAKES